MTHARAAVLRVAKHLQYFYRFLAPCAQERQRSASRQAALRLKRSFIG
jgi:hypothetical protein